MNYEFDLTENTVTKWRGNKNVQNTKMCKKSKNFFRRNKWKNQMNCWQLNL